jgi:hypothetical protein
MLRRHEAVATRDSTMYLIGITTLREILEAANAPNPEDA